MPRVYFGTKEEPGFDLEQSTDLIAVRTRKGRSITRAPGPVPDPMGNCGSHFGDVVDGTDFLVWGWYGGGTLLIDVSDKANPAIAQQVAPHGSIWDARYFNGHVYSADSGVSVLRVV